MGKYDCFIKEIKVYRFRLINALIISYNIHIIVSIAFIYNNKYKTINDRPLKKIN